MSHTDPVERDEAPAPVDQCCFCAIEVSTEFLFPDPGGSICDMCRIAIRYDTETSNLSDDDRRCIARMLNTLRTSILARLK